MFHSAFSIKVLTNYSYGVGYTSGASPIDSELAFFSTPATAVIKNAFQVGAGYEINDRFTVNGVYHYGTSSGSTTGQLLNPMAVTGSNPYGALPGTSVSYSMTTSMVMFGLTTHSLVSSVNEIN
ncbi:MAG: hypothetical protein U5K54_25505 [Cytophagales bacterium]|nr:hypothetical protein [Cytophagales bacterium]